MRLAEEGRSGPADLPREEDRLARADPPAAGFALSPHRRVDRTRTSLPLVKMVQRGRDARETPAGAAAVEGGPGAACHSLGELEDGGGMEQGLNLVHPLRLLFRVLAGVCEQALHRRLVGRSVVVDYGNGEKGEGRGAEGRIGRYIYTDRSLGLDWLPPASFCRSIVSLMSEVSSSIFNVAVSVAGRELIAF